MNSICSALNYWHNRRYLFPGCLITQSYRILLPSAAITRIDDNNGNQFLWKFGIFSVTHPVALRSVQNLSLFENRSPLLRNRSPQNPSPVARTPEKFGTQTADSRRAKRQILKVTAIKTSYLSNLRICKYCFCFQGRILLQILHGLRFLSTNIKSCSCFPGVDILWVTGLRKALFHDTSKS